MIRAWSVRLFGVTALIAVASFWWQVMGLHGSHGLMPIALEMSALKQSAVTPFDVPSLFWFADTDLAIHFICALSSLAAVFVTLAVVPRVALALLWLTWLSLVTVCSPFLNFQWDVLLLESTFCFFFYASNSGAASRMLLAVLASKVTLESGLVKVMGHDPAWRDLTALTFHWWSQPLPTWSSAVLYELPLPVQKALCALTLALELGAPLLVFGPFKLRRVAALALIGLQVGLFAAGNYSYFNVLAAVIALPLLAPPTTEKASKPWHWALVVAFVAASAGAFMHALPGCLTRFATLNGYGAFAHMTTTRREIIIEGSDDAKAWKPYDFRWKPGRVDVRPRWAAPWQPRLDWQMWFAALGTCGQNEFMVSLQRHLLLGTPEVLALMAPAPFERPPKFMRAEAYQYRFAPLSTKDVWWVRTYEGAYCPTVTLDETGALRRADTDH